MTADHGHLSERCFGRSDRRAQHRWLGPEGLDDRGRVLRVPPQSLDEPRLRSQGLGPETGLVAGLNRILAAWKICGYLADATVGRLKKLPASELRRWLRGLAQYAPASRYGLAAAPSGPA
jgi:hypothetical protein